MKVATRVISEFVPVQLDVGLLAIGIKYVDAQALFSLRHLGVAPLSFHWARAASAFSSCKIAVLDTE